MLINTEDKEKRTLNQNAALHLFFEHLAQTLNDGGFTVQLVLQQRPEVEWNKDLIKKLLWRPFQQAVLGKESTTELRKREDIDKVYDELNRFVSQFFGTTVEFPSIENRFNKINNE